MVNRNEILDTTKCKFTFFFVDFCCSANIAFVKGLGSFGGAAWSHLAANLDRVGTSPIVLGRRGHCAQSLSTIYFLFCNFDLYYLNQIGCSIRTVFFSAKTNEQL